VYPSGGASRKSARAEGELSTTTTTVPEVEDRRLAHRTAFVKRLVRTPPEMCNILVCENATALAAVAA
jgi:hypothetical protein